MVNSDKLNPTEDVFVVLSAAFVELVTLSRGQDGEEEHVLLSELFLVFYIHIKIYIVKLRKG